MEKKSGTEEKSIMRKSAAGVIFMSRYAELKRADGFDVAWGAIPTPIIARLWICGKENYSRIISRVGEDRQCF